MELFAVADQALSRAKSHHLDQALVGVSSTVSKEFNVEANRLTLLRTTYDQGTRFSALLDGRQATHRGNQLDADSIQSLVNETAASAQAAPQDPFNGFAPSQGEKSFEFNATEADPEWMLARLRGLLADARRLFPKIIIEGATLKFVSSQEVLATSDGTRLSARGAHYEGFVIFTAKEGRKASSFNYTDFQLPATAPSQNPGFQMMNLANLNTLLEQASEQLETRKVPQKFEGDVIVTPHCMGDLVGAWASFLSPGQMMKGSSFFNGKLNQTIGSPTLTLMSQPVDSNFASRRFWTSDGYLSANEIIFENGVLKNYLLNHYAAKKLGQNISRSEGTFMRLQPGNEALSDMIAGVKKGVLMCRYSAGNPAENGDVSGVAKNSYYIEGGAIRYPLSEAMVAMNLSTMLKNVEAIFEVPGTLCRSAA